METKPAAAQPQPAAKPAAAKPMTVADVPLEVREKIEAELRDRIRKEEEQKFKAKQLGLGPKYRAIERTYFDDRLIEADQEFVTHSNPGPHMIPLNDEAKEIMKKLKLLDEDGNVIPMNLGIPQIKN